MAWLRLYDSIVDDPKIQMLPDRAFRMLINLWCLAKRRGGTLPNDIPALAFALRWHEKRVKETLQALIRARLIDIVEGGFQPHDWDQHQFASDGDGAERMRRYRARNGRLRDVTSDGQPPSLLRTKQRHALRNSDVLEPDTEPDTEPESPLSPPKRGGVTVTVSHPVSKPQPGPGSGALNSHAGGFEELYADLPRQAAKRAAMRAYQAALQRGATHEQLLAGARRYAAECAGKDPQFIKHPATWLNHDCWLDEAPNGAGRPQIINPLAAYHASGKQQ